MISATRYRTPSIPAMLQSALILIVAMALRRAILHAHPGDESYAVPAAIVMAIGGFGIAARLQRHLWVPPWAAFASTGIFAIALIATAIVVPAAGTRGSSEVWMLPWYLMTVGMVPPTSARGACASPALAARVLVGTSLVLGFAEVLAATLEHR